MAFSSSVEEDRRQPLHHHVLLVAFSAQGHLNPMLRFGNLLGSKGLQITLATNELARERLMVSPSTTNTANNSNQIHLEFFSDGLPIDYDRKSNVDYYMDCLSKFGPQNLSKIVQNCSPKLSCIVNNPFVPWVADVAAEHEIPCAMLWIQPCALYAIYYRYYNQLNRFPIQTDADSSMEIQLPGLPILKIHDLPSFVLPSNTIGSFPKLLSQMFKNMNKLKWVLANSFYELEKDVVESMNGLSPILPVGPLVPTTLLTDDDSNTSMNFQSFDMWRPEESCIEWLDKKPPSSVIYVSFGSVVEFSAIQMKNIALGLKNSNHYFLWVVKTSEKELTDGRGQLPNGFLEEIEDKGLVVSWCPQTRVLIHPAIACFLTHCGWNSTLEAVASGVPVIGFPVWTDQPTNAKLITDVFRMGVRVEADEDGVVSEEEVGRCISEVMDGEIREELKKKAEKWKGEARKAFEIGGSSYQNIQFFIDEINKC